MKGIDKKKRKKMIDTNTNYNKKQVAENVSNGSRIVGYMEK